MILMTIEEASKKYNISIHILKEYESWGLCQEVKKVMGSWQYDETDFERTESFFQGSDCYEQFRM